MRSAVGVAPLGLFLALLPVPPAGATSLDEARALHGQGKLADALEAYREVVASPDVDAASAAVAYNNSCVILTNSGDHRHAVEECLLALAIRRELDDEQRLGRTLNNLGLAQQNLGRYSESEISFEEALEINRRIGDSQAEVINLANLGGLATVAGHYDRAIDFLAAASSKASLHADEPWASRQVQIAQVNRGVVLEKLGAFREALDLYKGVLDRDSELDPWQSASLRVNNGVMYRNLGDPVRALEELELAAATYRDLGYRPGLSNTLLNIGLVHHFNLQDDAKAETSYREALRLADEAGDHPELIQDLFYLGRLLADEGRLPEAKEAFTRCLAAAELSGSREGRWSALEGLGRVAREEGALETALQHLESAIEEVESVRSELEPGAGRTGYFGDKRSVFAAAVEVLADLHRRAPEDGRGERALRVAQQAKVRDLLDVLGPSTQAAIPMEATELESLVGADTLFEFFIGESRLFLWAVRAQATQLFDLGEAEPILDLVGEVYDAVAGDRPIPKAALTELSRVLVRPGELPPEGRRLWVAADGALRYLPFELLEAPGLPASILADHAVSYLPSGSALQGLRRAPSGKTGRVLGFGDPVLPRSADRAFSLGTLVSRIGLRPLPGAAREFGAMDRWLSGQPEIRTGSEATEAGLRDSVAGGVDLLHLATHTVIEDRPGGGAVILLTPEGADDGMLRPEEIAAMDLPAGLTVLAACSTALGTEPNGAALATLTGSFLAAGTSAVVATLWEVGDTATSVFMEQLYFELGRGHEPVEALRRVKRRLRSDPEWDRPNVWSAFVLVGAGHPVGGRRPLGTWLLIASAVVGLIWLAQARRKQPRSAASDEP